MMQGGSFQDQMIKNYIESVFNKYDTDRNGSLDIKEMTLFFNDLFRNLGINTTVTEEQSLVAIRSIDDNSDGLVDRAELFKAFKMMLNPPQQPPPPPPNPYGNQGYGNPYGSNQMGVNQYGGNPYGNNGYGNPPYGGYPQQGGQPYGNNPYGYQSYNQPPPPPPPPNYAYMNNSYGRPPMYNTAPSPQNNYSQSYRPNR